MMKRLGIVGVIVALLVAVAMSAFANPIHVGGGPRSNSDPIHVGGGPRAQ
jgi:hypothetical protein